MNPTVHITLKFKGAAQKIAIFNEMVGARDRDWPFNRTNQLCEQCGGAIYKNPIFDIDDLKRLSTQINDDKEIGGHLKVKIVSWLPALKCAKHQPHVTIIN